MGRADRGAHGFGARAAGGLWTDDSAGILVAGGSEDAESRWVPWRWITFEPSGWTGWRFKRHRDLGPSKHPGYHGLMIRARVSQLKNQLSRYLAAVRRGEVVQVLDRDTPVAQIVPIPRTSGGPPGSVVARAFFEEQARLGMLQRGTGVLPKEIVDTPPPGRPGVLAELIAERRRGR